MKRERFESPRRRKSISSRTLVLMLSLMMVIGCVVGGTVAWLSAKTNEVKNTFSASDIGVTLDENKGTAVEGEENTKEFKMIPGWMLEKDPVVSVTADSEDCYLFVKVIEDKGVVTYTPSGETEPVTTKWSDFLSYEIADGWNALDGVSGVYYKIFDSKDTTNTNVKGTLYSVLKDDQVQVKETVTKEMMNALTSDTQPTLTFTAYAVQLYKNNTEPFSPAEAWNLAQGLSN